MGTIWKFISISFPSSFFYYYSFIEFLFSFIHRDRWNLKLYRFVLLCSMPTIRYRNLLPMPLHFSQSIVAQIHIESIIHSSRLGNEVINRGITYSFIGSSKFNEQLKRWAGIVLDCVSISSFWLHGTTELTAMHLQTIADELLLCSTYRLRSCLTKLWKPVQSVVHVRKSNKFADVPAMQGNQFDIQIFWSMCRQKIRNNRRMSVQTNTRAT